MTTPADNVGASGFLGQFKLLLLFAKNVTSVTVVHCVW